MEGGALFNPGFLGSNFQWWVGQVADDSSWRKNHQQAKFKDKKDIPGWGYRYKVRIIGLHDQDEESIESDQLPWAQVMYPITAGGGQGGAYQSPAIRQGNFVFGFFLDDVDQQVPVIMGILGANATTEKQKATGKNGGSNFTPQSGFADTGDDTKIVPDADLQTEQPAAGAPPSKESPDSIHQESAKDKKKKEVLDRKHTLSCPDPVKMPPMKGIQTTLEKLVKEIQRIQRALTDYAEAVSTSIDQLNSIGSLIRSAACDMAKFLKTIMGQIQDFVTDLTNKLLQPVIKVSPPTIRIEMLENLVKGLETVSCVFNAIGIDLCDSAERSIRNSFARRSSGSPAPESVQPFLTEQYAGIPWFSPEGDTYNPTPTCYAEEIVGDILGEYINDIIQGSNAAMGPVVDQAQNTLAEYGLGGGSPSGSSPSRSGGGFGIPNFNVPDIPGMSELNLATKGLGILADLAGGGGPLDIASNIDSLASLGGFDISSAMSFVSMLSELFSCDPRPKCSPNDSHTLKEGGSGKPSTDKPNTISVAQAAAAKADEKAQAEQAAVAPTPFDNEPDAGPNANNLPIVGGAPLGRDEPIRTIQDFVEDPNNPGFASPSPPRYNQPPPQLLYDSSPQPSGPVDNRTQAQRRADRVARLGEARVREIEERDAAARRAGAE
tara:strand:- start:1124 stop:3109 length:1986 start_codon:yes stop_codon:yes gene_type:complete